MRIAISTFEYLPAMGGMAYGSKLLAEGLARRGHDVTLVTREIPGSPAREELAGVHVVRIPMFHLNGYRVPRGYLRSLARLDADVFHIKGNRIWNVDFYLPFAGHFEWPSVITAHNFYHYWMRPGYGRHLYYDRYFAGRLQKFDRYVALTEAEKQQVIGWGYPQNHIATIPDGIDPEEFKGPFTVKPEELRDWWKMGGRKVAVYAGGFYDNKRIDRLIHAIGMTDDRWGLVVIGPDKPGHPYDLAHCQETAYKTGAKVVFTGSIHRQEVLDIFHAADAYVQGSCFEGFGIGLIEAMASDLPFLAFERRSRKGTSRHRFRSRRGLARADGDRTRANPRVVRAQDRPERGPEMVGGRDGGEIREGVRGGEEEPTMRILRLNSTNGPLIGGAEVYIHRVSEELNSRGHADMVASIVTEQPPASLNPIVTYKSPSGPYLRAIKSMAGDRKLVRWLDNLVETFRPDIIHLHHFRYGASTDCSLARLPTGTARLYRPRRGTRLPCRHANSSGRNLL